MVISQQKTKKKWKKGRIILFFLIAGFLYGLEQRYHVFRVANISYVPDNILEQDMVWRAMPEKAAVFWPILFWRSDVLKSEIEHYYPVHVDLKSVGWGKFRLNVIPLEPYIKVYWSGMTWYLSDEGKIWRVSLGANALVHGIESPKRPLLVWGKDMPIPINMDKQRGDITQSSLPVQRIKSWYHELDRLGWNEKINRVTAIRSEGRFVLKLEFKTLFEKKMVIMINDDPAEWQSISQAVSAIQKDRSVRSEDLFIDTTYKGKLIVRSRDL